MAVQVQTRRGTTAEHSSFTGANGEVTVDTDKEVVVVHDGATAGGYPQMRENGSNSALALGSAGTPSLKFTGDTNTGIYSPGADQVAISTNGTGRLFVDASGNVGVGVAVPANPVDVLGSSGGAVVFNGRGRTSDNIGVIRMASSDSVTEYFRIQTAAASSFVGTTGSTPLIFNTLSTERLRITATGLVGVGTSSPAEILHVSGNMRLTGLTGATQTVFAEINANNLSTTVSPGVRIVATTGSTTSRHELAFYTTSDNAVNTTEKVRIDASGRVGIGTSSPGCLLDAAGMARFAWSNSPASGFGIEVVGGQSGTGIGYVQNFNRSTSSYSPLEIAGSYLTFRTSAGGDRLYIDTTGRVGIGTTSPDTALTVLKNSNADFTSNTTLRASSLVTFDNSQTTTAIVFKGITTNPDKFIFADNSGATQGFGLGHMQGGVRTNSIQCTQTDNIIFNRSGSENGRWDSSGRLLVGTSSSTSVGNINGGIQLAGSIPSISVAGFTNTVSGGYLVLGKSRGTTVGTVVQSNDVLGEIRFAGDDGTDLITLGASITGQVDGTPGANDMPGRLVFSTTPDSGSSPVERMRLDNAGNMLLATTSNTPFSGLFGARFVSYAGTGQLNAAAFTVDSSNSNSVYTVVVGSRSTGAVANTRLIAFVDANTTGTLVGTISHNGSSTAYNTTSDYRLKENVVAVTDGITRLQQLKPSRFNFIADPDKTVDGFIAHEVQTIVPEAITGEKDAVDDDGNPIYQGIDQSKLVPLLTAALQELVAEVESLKAEVAALKAQ